MEDQNKRFEKIQRRLRIKRNIAGAVSVLALLVFIAGIWVLHCNLFRVLWLLSVIVIAGAYAEYLKQKIKMNDENAYTGKPL